MPNIKSIFTSQNNRIHRPRLLLLTAIHSNLTLHGMRQTLNDLSPAQQLLLLPTSNFRHPPGGPPKPPFRIHLLQLPEPVAKWLQLLHPNNFVGFVADELIDRIANGSFLHEQLSLPLVAGRVLLVKREEVIVGNGQIEPSLLLHKKDYISKLPAKIWLFKRRQYKIIGKVISCGEPAKQTSPPLSSRGQSEPYYRQSARFPASAPGSATPHVFHEYARDSPQEYLPLPPQTAS